MSRPFQFFWTQVSLSPRLFARKPSTPPLLDPDSTPQTVILTRAKALGGTLRTSTVAVAFARPPEACTAWAVLSTASTVAGCRTVPRTISAVLRMTFFKGKYSLLRQLEFQRIKLSRAHIAHDQGRAILRYAVPWRSGDEIDPGNSFEAGDTLFLVPGN